MARSPGACLSASWKKSRSTSPASVAHNGAVITLLAICKLTHRRAYFYILMVAVLAPLAALVAVVALGTVFGSF